MGVYDYTTLVAHFGHSIECVTYAGQNVALECTDCHEILVDFNRVEQDLTDPEAAFIADVVAKELFFESFSGEAKTLTRIIAGYVQAELDKLENGDFGDDKQMDIDLANHILDKLRPSTKE